MASEQSFNPGEFRKALGSFTTGVTVVTTRGLDDNDVGLTANSFNSVSLEPPMILWSLGNNALSMTHFKAAEYFAVHILSADQEPLSGQFARRGVDKFAGVDIERGPGGVPLLKHCAARFICKTAHQYEGGDHLIFVGEVIDFAQWERAPLLFHGGSYGQIQKPSGTAETGSEFTEDSLGYLLRLCSHQILRPLKLELARRGLSIAQYYLLALVARIGHKPLAEVMELAGRGDNPPSSADIEDLARRGLIVANDADIHLTDTGSQLHVEVASIYKASESTALQGLDFDTRQTLTLALQRLIKTTKAADH